MASDQTQPAGQTGGEHDLEHLDLARNVLTWFGRATSPSREPGADPKADALAAQLNQWLPNLRAAPAPQQQAGGEPAVTITFGDTGLARRVVLHDASLKGKRVDFYTAPQQQAGGEVVAWIYERIGSELNPHLCLAGKNADELRVGAVNGLLKPCSNHVNWRPLTYADTTIAATPAPEPKAATVSRQDFTIDVPQETLDRLTADRVKFQRELAGLDSEPEPKAEPVVSDQAKWCEYVAGMVYGWLETIKELPPEERCTKAIAGIIERRLWALRAEPVRVPDGFVLVQSSITEEMHVAAVKVLQRANGLDGLPQRMLDALTAAQAMGGA